MNNYSKEVLDFYADIYTMAKDSNILTRDKMFASAHRLILKEE